MKKLFMLVMLGLVTAAVDSHCRDIILPEGFSIVDTTSPYVMVKTPYADYPVQLLEYEPKEVLRVNWGLGKEDIALEYYTDGEGMGAITNPDYAINSKGEIYILDAFSNRIQKYSPAGKYVNSIPIYGRAERNGKSVIYKSTDTSTWGENHSFVGGYRYYADYKKQYYDGLSMQIDTMDNLYYLVQKGKDKWEVWKYKDDMLVWKREVIKESGLGVYDELRLSDEDGKVYVWLTKMGKGVIKQWNPESEKTIAFEFKPAKEILRVGYKIEVIDKGKKVMRIVSDSGKVISISMMNLKLDDEIIKPNKCFITADKRIRVYTESSLHLALSILEYNEKGEIIAVFIEPRRTRKIDYDYYKEKCKYYGGEFGEIRANSGEAYIGVKVPYGQKVIINKLVPVKNNYEKK